ncbi:MAG: cache domain-containing protein [Selenomonadaceae bacterium]|nr:cache domain-containing protein [Selenomonadaceae bacterium]
MGIKQKFFALSGFVGVILAIVSCIGYFGASNAVREGVEREITASVAREQANLDGWLTEKARVSKSAASLMSAVGSNPAMADNHELLKLFQDDKEILVITHGTERNTFISSANGNRTGQINPNDREWYQDIKKGRGFHFTEPYMSKTSKKLVVSAITPYKNAQGQFAGGVCENITLDVLGQKVKELNFRGQGNGVIISAAGKVLASTRSGIAQMSEAKEMPGMGQYYDEMKTKGSGYLNL